MSLGLLLPMGLLALAGLIVPLLIHLIRRPDHQMTDFAALRWLRESVRPRRRLRFDDLWLLLARLALLSLLALILALPILNGDWRAARHVIAVASDVDLVAARKQLTDDRAEWRWLAPGFPSVDEKAPVSSRLFSSLLRELDSTLASKDTLTVVVPIQVSGLDAQRIALVHAVDWQQVAGETQTAEPRKRGINRIIAIRHEPQSSTAFAYLRAAVGVWSSIGQDHWEVDEGPLALPLPETLDCLIWLGGPLPDSIMRWVEKGGRVLLVDSELGDGLPVWRDEQGKILAREQALGRGAVIRLPAPLTAEKLPDLLDADFPHRLQALLIPAPRSPDRAFAREVVPTQVDRDAPERQTSLIPLIGLLIALVFLLERVLATRRQRA